jgi:hypothetical protein
MPLRTPHWTNESTSCAESNFQTQRSPSVSLSRPPSSSDLILSESGLSFDEKISLLRVLRQRVAKVSPASPFSSLTRH